MEKIKIPSPSAILDPLPTVSPTGVPKVLVSTASAHNATSVTTNKPKQSKSRNGCITCKAKRLKCDETKPTCLQCKKRNVDCGGYKKDFKWRPFEESNISSRNVVPNKKKAAFVSPSRKPTIRGPSSARNEAPVMEATPLSPNNSVYTPGSPSRNSVALNNLTQSAVVQTNVGVLGDQVFDHPISVILDEDVLISPEIGLLSPEMSPGIPNMLSPPTGHHEDDISRKTGHESSSIPDEFSFEALLEGDGNEIEEIVRRPDPYTRSSILDLANRATPPHLESGYMAPSLHRVPVFDVASPEMLVQHFDRSTCGILSVKDGAHENPWRTLIWPLATDTPALYHAIFSLAAFHSSKDSPALRVHGVDHMRKSITYMVQDIQNMRADAALATSLALAFADTWDQHTRTCIQHLRGAKALVAQVVEYGLQGGIYGNDLARVRFLYNTWLYMDVIARLTSLEDHGEQQVDVPFFQLPDDSMHEIDPLMGCATTLFPFINQVAQLIQRVRRTESNSISLISQAIELKRLVEQWEPPDWFEPPEDPSSEVQHSIQIAHAYRWATLLYLHQAVPEMPSEPASDLAKRVLVLLATVPPSSRTTIIQMFPLLMAGCEADQEEDRSWVLDRWSAIQSRLMLGSIDRCIDVVREVWTRRDTSGPEKQLQNQARGANFSGRGVGEAFGKRKPFYKAGFSMGNSQMGAAISPLVNIEFEKTVRGRLHWAYVMQEWGWEVFLG